MGRARESVVRCADAEDVAARAAATVLELLAEAQQRRGASRLVLTGGSIARTVHAEIAHRRDAQVTAGDDEDEGGSVDWGAVDVYWGDERFVARDDPERNAGQARHDMLERLPVDPARVHEVAAADETGDVEAAAAAYAEVLPEPDERGCRFDVLMLGIGPDGHCASLFPGRPEVSADDLVLPVRDAPKPPPTRVSLGMPALRAARHVLFVATGEEKAEAVARAMDGDDVTTTPAAGPRGLDTTAWFVDEAAGGDL